MDLQGLGSIVLLNQGRTQAQLTDSVKRLSSGLRINSAQDDPSGLAISEKLKAQVSGLDQGVRQIQDANNALNVADGALQTISDILQRLRALVVQANSDLETKTDQANVQVEIDQLTLEINRITQNTTFNGKQLLDGSLSSAIPQQGRTIIASNSTLAGGAQGGFGSTLIDTTFDPGTPAPGQPTINVSQLLQVLSYDPTTNQLTVRAKIFSSDPSFGPTQDQTFTVDAGTNYVTGSSAPTVGSPSFTQSSQNGAGQTVLSFNIGILTAADVGAQSYIVTLDPESKAPGQAAQVNSGSAEGSVLSIDIPAVNTINLGVNTLQLGDSDANVVAEYHIDYGIQTLANIRAQVGAQTVALQESGDVSNITSVNLQASESQIRDANIGQETTDFTRAQILVQIQTQVLSKLYGNAPLVLQLVKGLNG